MIKRLQKIGALQKYFFKRDGAEQVLIIFSVFSTGLVIARFIHTRELIFLFLPWNLFLAYLPYLITKWLEKEPGWIENRIRFLSAFFLWILFIPNSFYIITDLFHLRKSTGMPLWFDLALIFSFAWNGIQLGILSVRKMERIIQLVFHQIKGMLFIFPVMALNAFGIYIGQYLRFNSWDVLVNPFGLSGEILYLFIQPLRNLKDWAMIFCFTLLLMLIYESLKKPGGRISLIYDLSGILLCRRPGRLG